MININWKKLKGLEPIISWRDLPNGLTTASTVFIDQLIMEAALKDSGYYMVGWNVVSYDDIRFRILISQQRSRPESEAIPPEGEGIWGRTITTNAASKERYTGNTIVWLQADSVCSMGAPYTIHRFQIQVAAIQPEIITINDTSMGVFRLDFQQ